MEMRVRKGLSWLVAALGAAWVVGSFDSAARAAEEPAPTRFNSKLEFAVFAQIKEGEEAKKLGQTPAAEPLVIPACRRWWVVPLVAPGGKLDMAALRREVQDLKIPGLGLTDTNVGDAELLELKDLAALETLILAGLLRVTDAGLAHLKDLKQLQCLDLMITGVTDAGLAHLKDLKQLQSLNLYATQVTDVGLAHLEVLKQLQWLGLRDTKVTDAGLAHLKDLDQLQSLDLSFTRPITGAGLAHLKDLKQLRSLNLGMTEVTDAGLAHLKDLKQLQSLDLRVTQVTDVGLAHLKDLKQLQSLDLRGTQVTEAGLAHLKDLNQLQSLYLTGPRVTDAGLAHLKDLKQLRSLDLSFATPITDAGLAHLKDLNQLQSLNLCYTQVTDAGLAHLKDLKQLQSLDLGNTQVTDAGLPHLKDLKQLHMLELKNTKVTDAGLALLRLVLPALPKGEPLGSRKNLNQLAKACATYLNEFGDNRFYPKSTAELLEKKVLVDKAVLVAPSDPNPPALANGMPCSYVLCFDKYPNREFRDDFPPNVMMGWERMAFEQGGRSVLFFDSHVEFVQEARFQQLLKDLDEQVQKLKARKGGD